jgi:3-hydroxybutyryl-CoA dehydrogenase
MVVLLLIKYQKIRMNILVIGSQLNLEEAKQKFGETHHWQFASSHQDMNTLLNKVEVVFDFIPEQLSGTAIFNEVKGTIFFNTAFISLSSICNNKSKDLNLFGFCGMPTFLNRDLLEVTTLNSDQSKLASICKALNTAFACAADKVGLVTPRIICMIINEAYYTVEEGTATREDIDLAMKLGTNYPYGPFEWCKRIGAKQVCDLLEAVHNDTGDERHLICPLLKQEAEEKIS